MQKYIVVFCNSSPLTWDSCSHTRWCPSLLMASVCTTWWAMRGNGAQTGGRCITPQRRNTTRYGRNIIEDLWLFQSVVRLKDHDCFFCLFFVFLFLLSHSQTGPPSGADKVKKGGSYMCHKVSNTCFSDLLYGFPYYHVYYLDFQTCDQKLKIACHRVASVNSTGFTVSILTEPIYCIYLTATAFKPPTGNCSSMFHSRLGCYGNLTNCL